MILSIALMFAGVSALCLLLYFGAVYALPIAIGFRAGFWALGNGAGIASAAIGLAAGGLVFALGQVALGTVRSPAIRWVVFLAFLVPAIYAGYSMALQLAELSIPSPLWQHLVALIGAAAVGVSGSARLTVQLPAAHHRTVIAKQFLSTGLQKSILGQERSSR